MVEWLKWFTIVKLTDSSDTIKTLKRENFTRGEVSEMKRPDFLIGFPGVLTASLIAGFYKWLPAGAEKAPPCKRG